MFDDIWFLILSFAIDCKTNLRAIRLVNRSFNGLVVNCIKSQVSSTINKLIDDLPNYPIFRSFLFQTNQYFLNINKIIDLWNFHKLIMKTFNTRQYLVDVFSYIPNSTSHNLFFKWMHLIRSPLLFLNIYDYSFMFAFMIDPPEFETRRNTVKSIMKVTIDDHHEQYCLRFISCCNDNDIRKRFRYVYSNVKHKIDDYSDDFYKLFIRLLSQDHRLIREHNGFLGKFFDFNDHECWNMFWIILGLVGFQNLILNKSVNNKDFIFNKKNLNMLIFYFPKSLLLQRYIYLSKLKKNFPIIDLINLCLLSNEQFNRFILVNTALKKTHVPPFLHLLKKSKYHVREIPSGTPFDDTKIWFLYFLVSKKSFRLKMKAKNKKFKYPIAPFLNNQQLKILRQINRDAYFSQEFDEIWPICFLSNDEFSHFIKRPKNTDETEYFQQCFDKIEKIDNDD